MCGVDRTWYIYGVALKNNEDESDEATDVVPVPRVLVAVSLTFPRIIKCHKKVWIPL